MDLLRKIEKLTDDELTKFLRKRISLLEKKQMSNMVSDTIGYLLDYNASIFDVLDFSNEILEVPIVSKFDGYIPIGTKLVYGMSYFNPAKIVSNGGCYYYIDDDSYILEFCKYIKDKQIDFELELFDYLLDFCQKYFGVIETIKREDMIKLININEKTFIKPINEPVFSLFKNKGNYQCSEISIMTQNILAFLGFDTSLIIGNQKLDDRDMVAHAFNFVDFINSETKEKISILLDVASAVEVVDLNWNVIGISPYVYHLDKSKDEKYDDLVLGIIDEIKCPNYTYMATDNNIFTSAQNYNRHYSIGKILTKKEEIVQKVYRY